MYRVAWERGWGEADLAEGQGEADLIRRQGVSVKISIICYFNYTVFIK